MALSKDFTSDGYTWEAGKVYGSYNNAATLKCLEKKGYIKIYHLEENGSQGDVVSIIK